MKSITLIGLGVGATAALAYLTSAIAHSNPAETSSAPVVTLTVAGGTVTGHVKFDGKPPELKPLPITDEQAKGCCPAGKKVSDKDPKFMVDGSGGLANVVLTIEAPDAKID